jgi:hypothetical protein
LYLIIKLVSRQSSITQKGAQTKAISDVYLCGMLHFPDYPYK